MSELETARKGVETALEDLLERVEREMEDPK